MSIEKPVTKPFKLRRSGMIRPKFRPSLRRRRLDRFGLALAFQRQQKNQPNTGADRAVSDVESWKANLGAASLLNIEV